MGDIDAEKELAVALSAVRAASLVCQRVQRDLAGAAALEKNDRSPVTVADFAAQAIVCANLLAGSAVGAVVAEESGEQLRRPEAAKTREQVLKFLGEAFGAPVTAEQALRWIDLGAAPDAEKQERYWTLDPVDGTKGFLRAGQYAIALALIERGEVTVAALGCPNLTDAEGQPGVILSALRGRGARQHPLSRALHQSAPARVSEIASPGEARFCESVEADHSDQKCTARVASALGITAPPVRMDSQAKYALLARGEACVYLRLPTRESYQEKIWDHAAGALVVEEAGGAVTDVSGKRLDFSHGRTLARNRGVIATNGRFHPQVVAAVARALGG